MCLGWASQVLCFSQPHRAGEQVQFPSSCRSTFIAQLVTIMVLKEKMMRKRTQATHDCVVGFMLCGAWKHRKRKQLLCEWANVQSDTENRILGRCVKDSCWCSSLNLYNTGLDFLLFIFHCTPLTLHLVRNICYKCSVVKASYFPFFSTVEQSRKISSGSLIYSIKTKVFAWKMLQLHCAQYP